MSPYVFTDAGKHLPRFFNFLRVDTGKRFGEEFVGYATQFLDERLCRLGDLKPPGPPIGRVASTLDQPRFLQAVDDPAEGNRLDIEHVGKLDLPETWSAGQAEKHFPLRAGDAQAGGPAVERLAERVRGLPDFEG